MPSPSPSKPLSSRPQLPIAVYRLQFRCTGRIDFPGLPGPLWRSAFGNALRRGVCVTSAPTCDGCLMVQVCPYFQLIETAPPAGAAKMRRYAQVPHPYVIRPCHDGGRRSPGQLLELELTLAGQANAHAAVALTALEKAAADGLGPARGRATLDEVTVLTPGGWLPAGQVAPDHIGPPPDPPAPDHFVLEFTTPLRLRLAEALVTPSELTFGMVFRSLLRRVSMLCEFYGDASLETDFAGLGHIADRMARLSAGLRWVEAQRWSGRQQRRVPLGGIVGEMEMAGDVQALWPYLWMGQWLHVGKGAVMGFGQYRLLRP